MSFAVKLDIELDPKCGRLLEHALRLSGDHSQGSSEQHNRRQTKDALALLKSTVRGIEDITRIQKQSGLVLRTIDINYAEQLVEYQMNQNINGVKHKYYYITVDGYNYVVSKIYNSNNLLVEYLCVNTQLVKLDNKALSIACDRGWIIREGAYDEPQKPEPVLEACEGNQCSKSSKRKVKFDSCEVSSYNGKCATGDCKVDVKVSTEIKGNIPGPVVDNKSALSTSSVVPVIQVIPTSIQATPSAVQATPTSTEQKNKVLSFFSSLTALMEDPEIKTLYSSNKTSDAIMNMLRIKPYTK